MANNNKPTNPNKNTDAKRKRHNDDNTSLYFIEKERPNPKGISSVAAVLGGGGDNKENTNLGKDGLIKYLQFNIAAKDNIEVKEEPPIPEDDGKLDQKKPSSKEKERNVFSKLKNLARIPTMKTHYYSLSNKQQGGKRKSKNKGPKM